MKNLILFLMVSALMFSSCKSSKDAIPNYTGAEQVLGNGKIYSWLRVSSDDKPTSIGVTLTKGALENLAHSTFTEIVVPLAATAVGKTPFDHVFLSFSHSGHEPVGIYNVAHFDMHFVIQPLAERAAIPPYTIATAAKPSLPRTDQHTAARWCRARGQRV